MAERPKILLLDDDQFLLGVYRSMLSKLPSQPEVHVSNSGQRAIALLESEPFNVLISDLNMPKMDGLQVLSIVRRKLPQLKIVVLTAVIDEQYRSRAYAMGVDLFWQKPSTDQEIGMFKECIESLLERKSAVTGFRGIQSKSLVDIIQMECLTQTSSILKITNAGKEGRVWLRDGEVVDAATGEITGEEAFKEIFSWKAGNFETLPPDPLRHRRIFNSYQGLLLDSAQGMDEVSHPAPAAAENRQSPSLSTMLAKFKGVEFVLAATGGVDNKFDAWGLQNPGPLAQWARVTQESFQKIGDKIQAGEINDIVGLGPHQNMGMAPYGEALLCAGYERSLPPAELRETLKEMVAKWAELALV